MNRDQWMAEPTKETRLLRAVLGGVLAALAALLPACATAPKQKPAPLFFPPPPELPRIQYLTTLSGRKDVEKQSSFNRFVVGEQLNIQLDKPYGVAIYDGKIYVCDTNSTVIVLDLKSRTFGLLKGATGAGRLKQPLNISIEPDGTKYVTDPVRGQVVVFDRDDAYVKAYGTPGAWKPVDAAAFQDRLYVADMEKAVVRVFDKQSGALLKTIGDKGEPAEILNRPTNIAFDSQGYLYVADFGRFQVVKYDRDGHFKMAYGKLGDNLGHFARPKGIALDREGRLYAVDAAFNNVQLFSKEGRLLMFFGEGGEKPGNLLLPAKVSIDYDNLKYFEQLFQPGFQPQYLLFVSSQFGQSRGVSVFAFGKQQGHVYPSDAELLEQIDARRQQELKKVRPEREPQAAPSPSASPSPSPRPPGDRP